MNLHEPGRRVRVDRRIEEIEPDEYDALLVPGGFINPDLLRQSRDARILVQRFDALRKPIASLCHGPWVLASAELVNGRQLTSWPGIRDDLVHAGGVWRDEEVVRDGNWVTSRGPQDLVPFVRAMIKLFAEPSPILAERPRIPAPSSPPHSSPPFLVLAATAFTPRRGVASRLLRASLALAAGGLALFALRRAAESYG
jgi:protease I